MNKPTDSPKILDSIKPQDIDTTSHFYDAFGKMETETSARLIVKYLQPLNNWDPFSKDGLDHAYHEDFWFNGLDTRGFIQEISAGWYEVTDKFVLRCYKASPASAKVSVTELTGG